MYESRIHRSIGSPQHQMASCQTVAKLGTPRGVLGSNLRSNKEKRAHPQGGSLSKYSRSIRGHFHGHTVRLAETLADVNLLFREFYKICHSSVSALFDCNKLSIMMLVIPRKNTWLFFVIFSHHGRLYVTPDGRILLELSMFCGDNSVSFISGC